MADSADMARWHADVAAQHAKYRAHQITADDDLAAAVADVVTDADEDELDTYAELRDEARRDDA